MVRRTDQEALRSAIEERKGRLEEVVEGYFGSLLYDWLPALAWYASMKVRLPPLEGIDLSPIVVKVGGWELRWPYSKGPTAVLARVREGRSSWRGRWWYTDLLLQSAYNHRGRDREWDWASRFPKELLPPGASSEAGFIGFIGEERVGYFIPDPPTLSDIHRYQEGEVGKLLDLYDRVTERYLEAFSRVQELSHRILEEEKEFVDRIALFYVAQEIEKL